MSLHFIPADMPPPLNPSTRGESDKSSLACVEHEEWAAPLWSPVHTFIMCQARHPVARSQAPRARPLSPQGRADGCPQKRGGAVAKEAPLSTICHYPERHVIVFVQPAPLCFHPERRG